MSHHLTPETVGVCQQSSAVGRTDDNMMLLDCSDFVLGLQEECLAARELARRTVDVKLLLVHKNKQLALEN